MRACVLPSSSIAAVGGKAAPAAVSSIWKAAKITSPRCHLFFCSAQVHTGADTSARRIGELKNGVESTLFADIYSTRTMQLVDTIQHLGIGHLFEDQIEQILDRNLDAEVHGGDLFSTALRFRLLRQQGYSVSTEVFRKFLDKKGKFKESLSRDWRGLVSLHEASYSGVKDEEVLSQAMAFSEKNLRRLMLQLEPSTARGVGLGMEFPRQRRMARGEARSHILRSYGEERGGVNPDLLELATLDFNKVQSQHRTEISTLTRWWKDLGLAEKLTFARDRPLECFLWTVGLFPDPRLSSCRIEIAKTVAVLLVIDDVYDMHATLEELILFTNAIKRWGIEAMEELPEYMKICYMAIYNTTNEIGYRVLKEHGKCVIPELRKTWVDLCEAFLIEARWCSGKVVPNLEEYLSNGVTTAGTYMALVHAFYLMGSKISRENSELIASHPELFASAGRILRLWDDLGTAKVEQERGDVASSMECYMKENGGGSEDEARAHVRRLIHGSWMDLNGEALAAGSLPRSIVDVALNLARASQTMYQHGDDGRMPSVNRQIQTLLMEPIRTPQQVLHVVTKAVN